MLASTCQSTSAARQCAASRPAIKLSGAIRYTQLAHSNTIGVLRQTETGGSSNKSTVPPNTIPTCLISLFLIIACSHTAMRRSTHRATTACHAVLLLPQCCHVCVVETRRSASTTFPSLHYHCLTCRQPRRVVVRAGEDETVQLTGVVFAPFSEVGRQGVVLALVIKQQQHWSRQSFHTCVHVAHNNPLHNAVCFGSMLPNRCLCVWSRIIKQGP